MARKKAGSRNRKRRGRGEGSIFEREDGQWVGSISLGYTESGKRKRRTVYGATKQEVQDKLDTLRQGARSGTLPDAGTMTVGQLLDRWLDVSRDGTAPSTQEERERLVRLHIKPHLGGQKIATLGVLHIEGFYADLARANAGCWTPRQAADAFGSALGYALRIGLIAVNPSLKVRKPRQPRREMLCLTQDQVKLLLEVAQGRPLCPLVALALGTGCRQGELLALAWDDLDLSRGCLSVKRSLSWTKEKGFVIKEPKTATSKRTIALPACTVAILAAHREQAIAQGRLVSPVFHSKKGNHIRKRNVIRGFRKIVTCANRPRDQWNPKGGRPRKQAIATPLSSTVDASPILIPEGLRFHDLRHTVASLLLSQGQSLRAVSQRLGHASPTITLRIYSHVLPCDDVNLAAGIDRLMS